MAHQPVGDSQTLTTGTSSTMVQFAVQTDTVRVVPISQNVHVAIGTTAVATTSDYFVPAGTTATLNLGRASSMGIADIAKGAAKVDALKPAVANAMMGYELESEEDVEPEAEVGELDYEEETEEEE